ncbi:MAG: carboxypeptidase regulatory-like domain-containing protein [Phycisphaeraceae bacterium]|nr:carboxypeptidase regulatory-like domain-containing protein [Phycisphaeraceae bacterium]
MNSRLPRLLLALPFALAFALTGPAVAQDDADGATITGTVKFDGRQAKRRPVRMGSDQYCMDQHSDKPALSKLFIFGENDTLQNVFVYVSKGIDADSVETPEAAAVLDQVGCEYVPHVLGVVAGQKLKIKNSDDTLHNVKANPSRNPSFNEGMPVKGMVLEKVFKKPEMGIAVKCDVHAWMTSYIHVMDHPYFAVTGGEGTFELRGLPDGEYEVSVWHEFDKFQPVEKTLTVTVADGQADSELTFTYQPPQRKK